MLYKWLIFAFLASIISVLISRLVSLFRDISIIYTVFEYYPENNLIANTEVQSIQLQNEYTMFSHRNNWMDRSKLNRLWQKYVRNKNE